MSASSDTSCYTCKWWIGIHYGQEHLDCTCLVLGTGTRIRGAVFSMFKCNVLVRPRPFSLPQLTAHCTVGIKLANHKATAECRHRQSETSSHADSNPTLREMHLRIEICVESSMSRKNSSIQYYVVRRDSFIWSSLRKELLSITYLWNVTQQKGKYVQCNENRLESMVIEIAMFVLLITYLLLYV